MIRCHVRGWLLVAYIGAACGRLDFDRGIDGGLASDGDASNGDGSAAMPAPNVAFATSATFTGALGGLAGADAACMQAAQQAGLVGTFVAWLSTTTVNAVDRLSGARGWVRTDGLPIMDTITAGLAGQTFSPIDHDEHGLQLAYGAQLVSLTGFEPRRHRHRRNVQRLDEQCSRTEHFRRPLAVGRAFLGGADLVRREHGVLGE